MHTDRDPGGIDPAQGTAAGTASDREGGSTAAGSTGSVTASEASAIRRARSVGTLLDEAVRVPGTTFRVGLDPILGILPVGGDAVATLFALYPILEAIRFRLPTATVLKMVLFVAVDGVVGSIPVLGTLFDAAWKANAWNANTLERHLRGT